MRGTNKRNQREELTRGTNERKGCRPQAQENQSKLIQARKTLKARDRVLTAAIRRCHIELARKKSLRDIDASKNQVEAAWKEFNHANARYCARAGWGPPFEEEEQPEEARRALFEWKVLTDMMEQVVDKAEEYLESATKENSRDELCEDEDGGNELDAEVEVQRWMEQVSARNKVNEVALEVSAVSKVDEVEPEVSNVNKVKSEIDVEAKAEASNVNKVNEVNVNEVNVSKVNVNADEVKFDVNAEAKVEVLGMKEVKNLKDDDKVEVFNAKVINGKVGLRLCYKKAEAKQSRPANWDPGELPDAKDQMEMLDVEEVVNLVNIDKVGLQLSVKEVRSSSGAIEKALLIVLFLLRFVNGFRRQCPIELSDNG